MAEKKKRRLSLFFLPFIMVVPLVLWNIFQQQITGYIGEPAWNVGLIVFIVLVVAGSILPFITAFSSFFGGGYSFFWGGSKKGREILTNGRAATATVIGIGENSGGGTLTINDQPVLNIRLQIDDGYRQPYEVSFDTIVPRSAVPQFQPGVAFAVKVDPNDPQKVVLDPEGASKFQGSSAAGSTPTVGGKGWTQLDHTLLERDGKDGVAKVLSVEDTGRSEDFNPLVRVSYEVFIPREEPYTVTKDIPMPTQYVQQLRQVVGKSFPCRVHPKDPQKIQVNITF